MLLDYSSTTEVYQVAGGLSKRMRLSRDPRSSQGYTRGIHSGSTPIHRRPFLAESDAHFPREWDPFPLLTLCPHHGILLVHRPQSPMVELRQHGKCVAPDQRIGLIYLREARRRVHPQ
jgi:hypothetical protein